MINNYNPWSAPTYKKATRTGSRRKYTALLAGGSAVQVSPYSQLRARHFVIAVVEAIRAHEDALRGIEPSVGIT